MSTSSAPFDSRRTGFGACLYRGERPLGSNWRAGLLRSESGQYVESPERAEQVAACMEEGVRPEKSYRVLVDEDGDLVWVTETDGAEVRYDDEPQMILGQRFMSGSITVLPVEQSLRTGSSMRRVMFSWFMNVMEGEKNGDSEPRSAESDTVDPGVCDERARARRNGCGRRGGRCELLR